MVEAAKTVWDLKIGNEYVMLGTDGYEIIGTWTEMQANITRRKYNNYFLTSEDAEMELLRRESRAKAWKPEMEQYYWFIGSKGRAFETPWKADNSDFMYYHNGNVNKTKEDAYEWKAKYGKAF